MSNYEDNKSDGELGLQLKNLFELSWNVENCFGSMPFPHGSIGSFVLHCSTASSITYRAY